MVFIRIYNKIAEAIIYDIKHDKGIFITDPKARSYQTAQPWDLRVKASKHVVNSTVAQVIQYILLFSCNAKQSINDFCKTIYSEKDENHEQYLSYLLDADLQLLKKAPADSIVTNDEMRMKIYRALEKRKVDFELRMEQIKKDGTHYGIPNTEDDGTHPFLTLCEFKNSAEGYYKLNDLFFLRKELISNREDNHVKDDIRSGYKALCGWVEKILKIYDGIDNSGTILDQLMKREAVVQSAELIQWESTYRFILKAKIAKYMVENKLESAELPKILSEIYVRIGYLNPERGTTREVKNVMIMQYDLIVERAFKGTICENEVNLIQATSVMVSDISQAIGINFNLKTTPITNEDFEEMYRFFLNDFGMPNILRDFLQCLKPDKNERRVIGCLKRIFDESYLASRSLEEEAHRVKKERSLQKNKRNNKKMP